MELIYGIMGNVYMDKYSKKSLTFLDLIKILQRNWLIVLVSLFSFVATVSFIGFKSQPVYEATATLSFGEGDNIQGIFIETPNIIYQQNYLMNQVVILKSHRIAMSVIHKLQGSALKDSLSLLGFKTESQKSAFTFDKIKSLFFKKDSLQDAHSIDIMVKKFQESSKVSYGENKDIIELKATAPSPSEAALIVNTWIDVYLEYTYSDNKGEVVQTKDFLEKKLNESNNTLMISEERLRMYQKENDVISLSTGTEQLVSQLTDFESLYNQTRTELDAVNDQLNFLHSQLDENRKNLVDNMVKISNPVLETLQKEMADLVARKAAFEAQLIVAGISVEGNIQLIQMEGRLQGLTDQIIEETKKLMDKDYSQLNPLEYSEKLIENILEKEIAQKSLVAKKQAYKEIINEYDDRLEILPDKNLELARLERDVQLNSKVYSLLREEYEEAKIREATQTQNIHIIDRAIPPLDPVRPNKKLIIALAFLFGMCLSMAVTVGYDIFRDRVRNGKDIERMGFNVIGEIPASRRMRFRGKQRNGELSIERAKQIFPNILYQQNGHSILSEVYRGIRTTLTLISQEKDIQTILFTSPGPSEGKSTTIANLAISIARKGTKTLLVDGDLRRPVMDTLFLGSPRKIGLTNLLIKKGMIDYVIRETSINRLHLLAAGASVNNAPELLSSRWMQSILLEAKKRYKMILIDSPPILPVTDANILASIVDSVVLIMRSGKTSREEVRHAFDLLNKVQCHKFGAVVTGIKDAKLYEYKQYYSSYSKR